MFTDSLSLFNVNSRSIITFERHPMIDIATMKHPSKLKELNKINFIWSEFKLAEDWSEEKNNVLKALVGTNLNMIVPSATEL